MSQENVEVVRRMLQAFADGGLDAMAEFWDADIDWRPIRGSWASSLATRFRTPLTRIRS
jgi:ketosteroid isomerase-like protein